MKNVRYSGFYKLSLEDRMKEVAEFANFTDEEQKTLVDGNALVDDIADNMIENVIGRFTLPFAVGLNFVMNDKEYLIPMVTEEASVVAALSNGSRLAYETGGFKANYSGSIMRAQIQVIGLSNPYYAKNIILENKDKIKEVCNRKDSFLVNNGGGCKDVEVHIIDTDEGKMLIAHLIVDTLDAMGANAVNTMAEAAAPVIEELTGGEVYLRILSNLSDLRLARATVTVKKESLGGEEVVDKLITAYRFAKADPYRAATHNKGIMNGISAVVLATGNDTRAIEAGAHAYAARSGQYTSLTTWEKNANGDLTGSIEIPMALGLVGGATKIHPTAKLAVKMLDIKTVDELAMIIASVGLAQNLAAIRVLATEGVQKGHMSLHARNVATQAGAKGEVLDKVVSKMIADNRVNVDYAKSILKELLQ